MDEAAAAAVTHEADESKDVVVARKRLNQAIEATSQNRAFQVDDLRFAAGSPDNKFQWPQAILALRENDPNGARTCLTINKMPQHINQITNEQRQNRPSIKVSPVDDKGDKEVAKALTGIIRHIEYQWDADVAYATGGQNQVEHGEGYVRVLTDYSDWQSFEQDIQIHQVKNSFSVYMDPLGLLKDATGRFCQWAFVVEDLSKDEFERQFPDAKAINWELVGTGDDWKAWFPDSDTVRIAEYFCIVYEDKKLFLYDVNGQFVSHVEGEPLPPGVTAVHKAIKTRKTKKPKVMWQKMNGQEVIEERDWAGSFLPIVRMVGNEWYIDGKFITTGIVRNAKDAQRMFNYWKSTETETLALAPKAPFVGPAEAFEGFEDDWKFANTKNLAYLKYNQYGETPEQKLDRPERQIPPMPPIGIVNAALGAADDIKSATGQYDPSLGNNPQAKSGVALAREQRKTDIGTFHYIDNQARAVKQLGRILVDLVPKIYDTRRAVRILGEGGEVDHAQIDPEMQQAIRKEPGMDGIEQVFINPSVGRYDVTVSVGPGYTSKRQEAAEFMAQVLQGNKELMALMGDLYFEMLDVPGADKIAERLKKALPPGLAEPEDGEEEIPVMQTPAGPMPQPQAEQMMGDMQQALEHQAEQLKAAGDIDKDREMLKAEITKAELQKKDIAAAQDQLAAAQREFELKQQIAELQAKCQFADDRETMRAEHEQATEALTAQQSEVEEASNELADGQGLTRLAESVSAVAEAIAEQQETLVQVAKAATAPRKSRMVIDGQTLESVSEPA